MELNTSELKEKAKTLRAGDKIELSGTVYTSRDAAHKRIKQLIDEGGELPFKLTVRLFTTQVLPALKKAWLSAHAALRHLAEWTPTLPCCSIWGYPQ